MNSPPPASYVLDEAAAVAWSQLAYRCLLARRLPVAAAVIALLLLGFAVVFDGLSTSVVAGAIIGLIGVAVLVLANLFVLVPSRARAIFRETTAHREPVTLTVSPSGFSVEQPSGSSRSEWNRLVRWEENASILALQPNRALAYVLPKQQIEPDTLAFIRERLGASGLPRPGRNRA